MTRNDADEVREIPEFGIYIMTSRGRMNLMEVPPAKLHQFLVAGNHLIGKLVQQIMTDIDNIEEQLEEATILYRRVDKTIDNMKDIYTAFLERKLAPPMEIVNSAVLDAQKGLQTVKRRIKETNNPELVLRFAAAQEAFAGLTVKEDDITTLIPGLSGDMMGKINSRMNLSMTQIKEMTEQYRAGYTAERRARTPAAQNQTADQTQFYSTPYGGAPGGKSILKKPHEPNARDMGRAALEMLKDKNLSTADALREALNLGRNVDFGEELDNIADCTIPTQGGQKADYSVPPPTTNLGARQRTPYPTGNSSTPVQENRNPSDGQNVRGGLPPRGEQNAPSGGQRNSAPQQEAIVNDDQVRMAPLTAMNVNQNIAKLTQMYLDLQRQLDEANKKYIPPERRMEPPAGFQSDIPPEIINIPSGIGATGYQQQNSQTGNQGNFGNNNQGYRSNNFGGSYSQDQNNNFGFPNNNNQGYGSNFGNDGSYGYNGNPVSYTHLTLPTNREV